MKKSILMFVLISIFILTFLAINVNAWVLYFDDQEYGLDRYAVFNDSDFVNSSEGLERGNLTVLEYFKGQPLDGALDSGVIEADELDGDANVNLTHTDGTLNIIYPNMIVRLVTTSGVVKYCNIVGTTVSVTNNQHSVYYVDNNCAVQETTIANYIATDLSPGGITEIFNAMAHSGDIEVHQGAPIQSKINIKLRKSSFNVANLRTVSGLGIITEGFSNFTIQAGEYIYINDVVDTTIQNMTAGSTFEVVYRDGGTWHYDEYEDETQTGLNLTSCDDGTDVVTCSNPSKYRRYLIFITGYDIDDDKTEVHQRLADEDTTYANIGGCLNTEVNPITFSLPDLYTYTAVPLYMYCGKAVDTVWTEHFIDLRALQVGTAASDIDTSIFLTEDGTRPLTGNWNAGAFNITTTDSVSAYKFWGLFNWTTLSGFLSFTGSVLDFSSTILNNTIVSLIGDYPTGNTTAEINAVESDPKFDEKILANRSEDVSFGGDINVEGVLYANAMGTGLDVLNSATIGNFLDVLDDLNVAGTTNLSDDTLIEGELEVVGITNLSGATRVEGDLIIQNDKKLQSYKTDGTLRDIAHFSPTNVLTLGSTSIASVKIDSATDVTINTGNIIHTGTTNLSGDTIIEGNVSIDNSDLFISGSVSNHPEINITTTGSSEDPSIFMGWNADQSIGSDFWYDVSSGDLYIDNLFDNDGGQTFFRVKVSGTPVNVMTLDSSGVDVIGDLDISSTLNNPLTISSDEVSITPPDKNYIQFRQHGSGDTATAEIGTVIEGAWDFGLFFNVSTTQDTTLEALRIHHDGDVNVTAGSLEVAKNITSSEHFVGNGSYLTDVPSYFQRTGDSLSPINVGDSITTTGTVAGTKLSLSAVAYLEETESNQMHLYADLVQIKTTLNVTENITVGESLKFSDTQYMYYDSADGFTFVNNTEWYLKIGSKGSTPAYTVFETKDVGTPSGFQFQIGVTSRLQISDSLTTVQSANGLRVNTGNIGMFRDNAYFKAGAGSDAGFMYNGSDMIIDPNLVGSGSAWIGATGDDDIYFNDAKSYGNINANTISAVDYYVNIDQTAGIDEYGAKGVRAWTSGSGLIHLLSDDSAGGFSDFELSPDDINSSIDGSVITSVTADGLNVYGDFNITGYGSIADWANDCGIPSAMLYAEESVGLDTGYEWSMGNGATLDGIGTLQVCSGVITAMSVQCDVCTGTTSTVEVRVSNSGTNCQTDIDTVSTGTGKHGFMINCVDTFSAQDFIQFYTLDDTGVCIGCVATAWVRYD